MFLMNPKFFPDYDMSGETGVEVTDNTADQSTEDEVVSDTTEETTETGTDEAETETDSSAETDEAEAKPERDRERDAIAAAARREAERRLKERDEEFARRFEGFSNPITGQPIRSEKDYFDALDAQAQLRTANELKSHGVDPKILEEAINNSPIVRQANSVLQTMQKQESERMIADDIAAISKIDSDIQTFDDLAQSENFQEVMNLVKSNQLRLADAYRLANFERLAQKQLQAAKQAAVNQARGKNHLTATGGTSNTADGMVDIPDNAKAAWKRAYPDLSPSELKKKYNHSIS